jgi:hypothetical protein
MSKLFPSKQTVVDHANGMTVILSDVKILTATSDHIELPNAADAGFLHASRETSDPSFYLTTSGNALAIDGATVGTEYTIVSRHDGQINFARGVNTREGGNVK